MEASSHRDDRIARSGVLRVVVTGSESTGKTTLAADLARQLGVPWVAEYARAYAERVPGALTEHDVDVIARGQIAAEDEALAALATSDAAGRAILVLDTDLVSTVAYAEHYYGVAPGWVVSAARERLADLYLLTDVDMPWTADGVRDQPHLRGNVQERFRRLLREFEARVVELRGPPPERLASALRAVALLTR